MKTRYYLIVNEYDDNCDQYDNCTQFIFKIHDRKIIWINNSALPIEVQNYINRIFNLRTFA